MLQKRSKSEEPRPEIMTKHKLKNVQGVLSHKTGYFTKKKNAGVVTSAFGG